MNVYDFDQTIFNPDSSFLFTVTTLKKYPALFFRILPDFVRATVGRLLGTVSQKEWKEAVFSYLPYLDDPETEVRMFWERNQHKIERWYLAQKREDDIIVSASPEFLLAPICQMLGVRLIGTRMDRHSGAILGENCSGEEKVRRLYEEYPDAVIEKFYSDALVDTPLARLAEKAYRVNHDKIRSWA